MEIKQLSIAEGLHLQVREIAKRETIASVKCTGAWIIRTALEHFVDEVKESDVDAIRAMDYGKTIQVKIALEAYTFDLLRIFAVKHDLRIAQAVNWAITRRIVYLVKTSAKTHQPIAWID